MSRSAAGNCVAVADVFQRRSLTARRLAALEVDDIIAAACAAFGVSRAELLKGVRGRQNVPRLLALMLCREQTPASGAKVGQVFGVAASTVSALAIRARRLVESDTKAHYQLGRLLRRLQNEQDET